VWKKEKTTLEHQVGRYEIVLSESEQTYTTTLTILTTQLSDAGKYTLFVRNDYGEVKATVSLMVKGQSREGFGFGSPFQYLLWSPVQVQLCFSFGLSFCFHFRFRFLSLCGLSLLTLCQEGFWFSIVQLCIFTWKVLPKDGIFMIYLLTFLSSSCTSLLVDCLTNSSEVSYSQKSILSVVLPV
jgi:hypothetical protein